MLKAQELGIDAHSIAGNPEFVNPETGDYRIKDNSPALKIGFKNFDMDKFGVQYGKLKAIAFQPELPVFVLQSEHNKETVYNWLGAVLKNMSTEGERSATGIDRVRGIIIISTEDNSPLKKAGIAPNDVLLKYDNVETNNWRDFQKEVSKSKKGSQIKLTIFRNQKEEIITINP